MRTRNIPVVVGACKLAIFLMPGFILRDVFITHPNLAASIGFMFGAIAQHFIAPRGTRRDLLLCMFLAVAFGVVRYLFDHMLLRYFV